jgi:hypothetical protein
MSDTETPASKKSRRSTFTTTCPRAKKAPATRKPAIALVFVSASKDPIVGSNHGRTEFYQAMHGKWCQLHETASIEDKKYEEPWSLKQLVCQWNKHIRKDMMVFLKHYRNVKNEKPSGYTENEHISMSAERFRAHKTF